MGWRAPLVSQVTAASAEGGGEDAESGGPGSLWRQNTNSHSKDASDLHTSHWQPQGRMETK